jgi:DNA-binding transcriptional MerR regulator
MGSQTLKDRAARPGRRVEARPVRDGSTNRIVRALRAQGMPREEIRAVVSAEDPELVRRILALHRERLEERLAARFTQIHHIERTLTSARG